MKNLEHAPSWGRLKNHPRSVLPYTGDVPSQEQGSLLPYGNGRSYGDSCHNDQGTLLHGIKHNKVLYLDTDNGILHAQSGILLAEILTLLQETNWFLPVVPGTKYVTLGGAIANDIHGKNHHLRGTFGCHVESFTLATSDGRIRSCSALENPDLYSATIGGMGLTGFITEAKIKLMDVPSHMVSEQKTPFHSIDAFISLSEELESEHEYSVAWCDSLATGKSLGKGIFICGDHCASKDIPYYNPPRLQIPVTPPMPLVSGPPLRLFNLAYYWAGARDPSKKLTDPNTFFFPLDAIGGWNRLYGPKGLYQHQSVIPLDTGRDALKALIRASQLAGQGSFLTVLKRFGNVPSPGLVSFPKPGFTLTLDFPARGEKTLNLLEELDRITLEAGGRINPYKDARMSAETFQQGYENWQKLEEFRDPAMMSDMWRRISARAIIDPPSLETTQQETPNVNQVSQPRVQVPVIDSQ